MCLKSLEVLYLLHSVSSRRGALLRAMTRRGADLSSRWVALGSKAVSSLNFGFGGVAAGVNEMEQICASWSVMVDPILCCDVLCSKWTTQKVGHSLLGHGNLTRKHPVSPTHCLHSNGKINKGI